MRVGWLFDRTGYMGGAEFTTAELAAAKPDGVELVDCPPGRVDPGCDRYVIHNCVQYSLDDFGVIPVDPPVFKYWNDVGSWLSEECRAWLDESADPVCCSPLQAGYMGFGDAELIPPPIDLKRFFEAASGVNGDRAGVVCAGSWRNRGKGAHRVRAWAEENGGVEFVGGGPFAPPGSSVVEYAEMPAKLAAFRTFVHLPEVIEPFGRCVVEAWAAGCELIVNDLVGAKYWVMEAPGKLETAAADFWKLILS